MTPHFILYVRDQEAATAFYETVLDQKPRLNVPGMTEFRLSDTAVLGLMPVQGIKNLLGDALPHASETGRFPGAELYLLVSDPGACHQRALTAGAKELSPLEPRDWGHTAAYSRDPDGYVLVFARET